MSEADGRTRQARAWKAFLEGVRGDLGDDLSYGQLALCESAFLKLFILSDTVRFLGRKKGQMVSLFFNKNLNTSFNCTSNSFRLDLITLYGPHGLKARKRIQSLEEYLREKEQAAKQGPVQSEKKEPGEE